VVNDGLRIRNQTEGSPYRQIKDKIMALTTPTPPPVLPGKNIDDYELFTGLQLNIKNTGNYFVADQVFVKFTKVDGEKVITDMIVMESKLTDAIKLSTRQGEAFTHKNGGFSGRTKNPENLYNKKGDYIESFKNIEIEPTFIKCYDKTDGSEIENLKIITNVNS
jgi:hypothetical protein